MWGEVKGAAPRRACSQSATHSFHAPTMYHAAARFPARAPRARGRQGISAESEECDKQAGQRDVAHPRPRVP